MNSLNFSTYITGSRSETGKCYEIASLLGKNFVAFINNNNRIQYDNRMSLNCYRFIYQLTTNFWAKYQLTTIFWANCQLTVYPISTLLDQLDDPRASATKFASYANAGEQQFCSARHS